MTAATMWRTGVFRRYDAGGRCGRGSVPHVVHSYQGWLFRLRNWPLAQRDRRFVNGITYRLASLCAWLW